MKRSFLSCLLVVILVGLSNISAAAESEAAKPKAPPATGPLVTISFTGYDALMKNLAYVGKLGNRPDLPKLLQGEISEALGGKQLSGLDKGRPWLTLIHVNVTGFVPEPHLKTYVPVSDLKQLLDSLDAVAESKDVGDGIFEIKPKEGGGEAYVKQVPGNWALVSSNKEDLAGGPADPIKALGGLHEKYLVAAKVSFQNLPQQLRDTATQALEALAQMQPGDQAATMKQSIDEINRLLKELDAIVLGLNIDEKLATGALEVSITAKPGTKTAAQIAKGGAVKTEFGSFLTPASAAGFQFAEVVDKEDLPQTRAAVDNFRKTALKGLEDQGLSEDQLKPAKQLVDGLMDVLVKTVESGKLEGGATLSLDSQAATLVAGGKLADGVQLEATLKQLVDLLNKEEPEIAKGIKLNTETYDAVRLSTFSIPLEGLPLPEDLKEILGKLFGKQFEAIVGIGDKSAYLAAGRNPARMLKSVMDANKKESGKVIPPFQLSVDALSIAKFTAAVATEEDAKRRAEILVKALAPSPAKSHLTVTSLAIPNGVKIRLEVQEGILRLLGSIPTLIGFPSEGAQ
ncbi:MAG: hypothetical protein ACLQNE_40465 [Thermoguttaceae bacterium]